MELPKTTTQPEGEEITSEDDDEKFDPLYEEFYGQPFLHYLRSLYCPYSILPYFKDCSFDVFSVLVIKLTSSNNKYHLVTEEFIADMLYQPDFTRSRLENYSFPSFPDKLYKDIAEVVSFLEPPSLKPDEYTHWMMTFLREDALDVEFNILSKTMDGRNKLPIRFHEPLYPLLHQLLNTAKIRLKEKLLNVVQPLIKICQPVHHEMSRVIIEIVEVAELRRIAAGNQFIGRSHLLWGFYKLGYALPLEIRNSIRVDVPDENHPPYHIYMAAAKLALMSGEKSAKLLHFIFVVIHSKDIGFDGQGVTELYLHFELFKEACDKMEDEIEPKHTVTVRPCRVVDAIIQDIRERYNN